MNKDHVDYPNVYHRILSVVAYWNRTSQTS